MITLGSALIGYIFGEMSALALDGQAILDASPRRLDTQNFLFFIGYLFGGTFLGAGMGWLAERSFVRCFPGARRIAQGLGRKAGLRIGLGVAFMSFLAAREEASIPVLFVFFVGSCIVGSLLGVGAAWLHEISLPRAPLSDEEYRLRLDAYEPHHETVEEQIAPLEEEVRGLELSSNSSIVGGEKQVDGDNRIEPNELKAAHQQMSAVGELTEEICDERDALFDKTVLISDRECRVFRFRVRSYVAGVLILFALHELYWFANVASIMQTSTAADQLARASDTSRKQLQESLNMYVRNAAPQWPFPESCFLRTEVRLTSSRMCGLIDFLNGGTPTAAWNHDWRNWATRCEEQLQNDAIRVALRADHWTTRLFGDPALRAIGHAFQRDCSQQLDLYYHRLFLPHILAHFAPSTNTGELASPS
jgi:hypothetical protein